MDFEFTDEQRMLRDLAKEFAERHIKPVIKQVEREKRFFREVLTEAAPLGLLGMTAPQEFGGLDTGRVAYCCVIEELAKVAVAAGPL